MDKILLCSVSHNVFSVVGYEIHEVAHRDRIHLIVRDSHAELDLSVKVSLARPCFEVCCLAQEICFCLAVVSGYRLRLFHHATFVAVQTEGFLGLFVLEALVVIVLADEAILTRVALGEVTRRSHSIVLLDLSAPGDSSFLFFSFTLGKVHEK